MAIVTLLTDSGESDHYVAAIKAKIISVNPGVRIEDISHKISPNDLAHAAFVLKAVFRDFPKGTIHLVGVDASGNRGDAFIALQLEDHFFIGVDNGLFGLISERPHQNLIELNSIATINTTFPERDVFAPAAARLALRSPHAIVRSTGWLRPGPVTSARRCGCDRCARAVPVATPLRSSATRR